MTEGIGSEENHRGREKGGLVSPVYSRRSGGLSVGINLFPDHKQCSFDCPYCEVFPFSTNAVFSVEQMETDLRAALASVTERNIPVKDICFSGNGEPSLSVDFPSALEKAGRIRAEIAPDAELVLITNGTGLLDNNIFSLLREAASGPLSLNIWLKLDAGTPCWYQKMNRSDIPFETIIEKIKEFSALAPVTIQTMLCMAAGEIPPQEEVNEWERLVLELCAITARNGGGRIRKVQMYGKARPSPEDAGGNPYLADSQRRLKTQALPREYLERRAASLRTSLRQAFALTDGLPNAVEVIPPLVEVHS
jgi:histidinol dehydrogenase